MQCRLEGRLKALRPCEVAANAVNLLLGTRIRILLSAMSSLVIDATCCALAYGSIPRPLDDATL